MKTTQETETSVMFWYFHPWFLLFQKCQYCGSFITEMKYFPTTCVQCSNGKCTLSFHVTCAHAAGVVFETSDWPHPVFITCSRHIYLTKTKVSASVHCGLVLSYQYTGKSLTFVVYKWFTNIVAFSSLCIKTLITHQNG